nr:MAG TPA: tail tape measure [Siphoviridae sp. cty4Z2]
MAGTVVRGSVLLIPKFDNLGANVKRALGSGYKSAVSVHTNAGRQAAQNYASGFGGATGAIMGVVSSVTSRALDAISGSIASAVNRVDTIANFPKIMQSVGYSADEARATIERLSTGIDGLPTSLDAIVGSVQKIAPVSGSLATATDVALAFNNALLAGGKSQEVMNSAFEQYSQMLSTGRVDMQSWKILAQAMPGQLNQIAKALLGANANQADLYKAMQSGAITFDQFNNAIVSLNNEGLPGYASFAEQARISTESIGTAWTNVQNRINKAVAKIIDHIGQANIAGAINDFSSSFSGIADTVITYLDPVISTVGSFMDQLQNNGAITSFGDALNALKDVFDSTIGLIGDLITTFTGLDSSEDASRSAADLLKSAVDGVKSAIELARDAVQGLRDNLTVVAPVIVAVATALIAYETIKAVRSIADDFGLLKSAASLAFDAIKGGEGVLSTLSVFGELVGEGGALASVFGTISTAISGVGTSLLALVGSIPVIGWIAVAVVALGAVFTWLWNTNEDFRNAVIGIWDSICSAISGAVDSIVGFFTTTLPTAFTQFVQFVQGIPAAVGQFIQELPSMVLYALTFAVVFLFGLGAQLAQLAVQIGSEFVQNVVNFFTVDLPSAFAQFVLFVSTIPEQVQTALATLLVNIALWAVDMAAKASEAADGFLRGVTDGLNAAVDFVKSVPDKIKSFFSNAGDWLVNSGKALLDGFAKGIRNAVNAVTSAASDALGAVRKLFPFSPAKKGPFSGHGYTTYSGRALMRDFARGIKGSSALAETEAMSALSSVHDVFSNARPLSFSAVADANANGIYRAAFELDSRQQRANATTLADIYDFMRNGELGQVIDENSNNIGDRDFARAVQKAVKTNA